MPEGERWIDLVDPSLNELRSAFPDEIHSSAFEQLLAPAQHDDEPRPKLEGHGDYIFGVFLVPTVVPEEDVVYYQEIDLIVTETRLLTVRKTPEGRKPYDISAAREACRAHEGVGMIAFHLVDDIAERYLDLVDALNDEIDELEDHVEEWPAEQVRGRLSSLRHDLLHIRRTLAPMRDAIRNVMDDRVELESGEIFTHDVELSFGTAYDKLLRAVDGLELSRDLVAGVRDYHQSKIANDQNEVMKRLTVVASVILLPTFIVGLYGQNFRNIPELRWHLGYAYSWAVILVTTAIQFWWFRRKKWL